MQDDHITSLLRHWQGGDRNAGDEALRRLEQEIRIAARTLMRRERPDHTLQPTDLMHDAYTGVARWLEGADLENRRHFIRQYVLVMRRVLVDHARKKKSEKRGGDRARVALNFDVADHEDSRALDPAEVIYLDELLDELARLDKRAAEIFTHSHFLGLGRKEISELLGIPTRTVDRKLQKARIWLGARLKGMEDGGE